MNFEKYYSRLPSFIKYNQFLFDFSLKLANNLRKLGKQDKQLNSQNELLNLLFTSCELKIKGTLRDVQLIYIELLRFLDNVCDKYELDYWIDYGTLLGAIRHGGFIPWDDDVDITMMREDYEKLIEVLPEEIKKYPKLMENCGLTLLTENQNNYFKDFKSVYDVEDENHLLNEAKFSFLQFAILKPYIKIDIFPKDYILDDELDLYSKNFAFEKYKFNDELKKSNNDFFEELDAGKRKIGLVNSKTNYCGFSLDHVMPTKAYIFKVDEIFPLKTINFENYMFKCPKNPDYYLQVLYGKNYMKIPDIIETHNNLSFIKQQFNSKEELDSSFQECKESLRWINDNF